METTLITATAIAATVLGWIGHRTLKVSHLCICDYDCHGGCTPAR